MESMFSRCFQCGLEYGSLSEEKPWFGRSGKSTWARKFCSYIHEVESHTNVHKQQSDVFDENGFGDRADREEAGEGICQGKGRMTYRVIHVAYDDLIPEELEAELIRDSQNHSKETKSTCWKAYRRAIVRCVDDLVAELSSLSGSPANMTCDDLTAYEKITAPLDEGDITGHHQRENFTCQKSQQEIRLVMNDASEIELTNALSQSQLTDNKSSQNSTSLSQIYDYSSSPHTSFSNDSKGSFFISAKNHPVVELEQLNPDGNGDDISGPNSIEVVPDFLKTIFDDVVRQQLKGELSSTVRWILVIDDNMYYSSMRYEFYQLARKHATGFAQVYFPVELATALQRNEKRRRRKVDEAVIRDMVSRLERPCGDIPWQNYTTTWMSEDWNQNCFENVLRLVDEAMSHPVMLLPPEDKAEADESRSICLTSLLHQADVALRKILGEHMATSKGVVMSRAERSRLAADSNLIRQQILNDLRSGILVIPNGMLLETSNDLGSPFHSYLRSIFHQQLMTVSLSKSETK